ncbi:hypothetical protein J2W14_000440 [Pseudarthrobacter oxydans]|uniref:hypothetical protein n=1 Tax=Pseudarthrobacter oxydans TaxID=1671 RepID=UPI00277DBDA9|nr:hypothetical protein [Pseudarthrobacter oxydans]MDP9981064.1 hypothetical protein [Pseudarthrobacter oxydans]
MSRRGYVPAAGEASDVELMPAGDVTDGVARVGGTIRRPHRPQSRGGWLESNAGRLLAALTR